MKYNGLPAFVFMAMTVMGSVAIEWRPTGPVELSSRIEEESASDTVVLEPRFSPLDVLPPILPGFAGIAELVENPVLAGGRRAASARGLESLGTWPCPPFSGSLLFFEPVLFGGLADEALFGGTRLSLGGSQSYGSVLPFGRLDLALEYDKLLGTDDNAKFISFGLLAGLAGDLPIPWILAGRALFLDAAPEGFRGTIFLGSGTPLVSFEKLGLLRVDGGLVYELRGSDEAILLSEFALRGLLALEGRHYRGALASGLAAWLSAEGGYDIAISEAKYKVDLGFEVAGTFGSRAGISGKIALHAGSVMKTDWAAGLRGRSDQFRAISGDGGATLSLELPLLFARGQLFLNPRLGVEFFLKPYLDAAMIPGPEGSAFFSRGNLYLCAGGELAMTLERDRREAVRFHAGLDFSELLQGEAASVGSEDLEIAAVFAIAL